MEGSQALPTHSPSAELKIPPCLFSLFATSTTPVTAPQRIPTKWALLLNYLSRPNVHRHGVTRRAEAVVRGEHTLYMIIEAAEEAWVRNFMVPFAEDGTLDVYPASNCAGVVSNGGCEAALPPSDALLPALDAEEACQQAMTDGLLVHRAHPLDAESSIPALMGGVAVPNMKFYLRNHFQIPKLDLAAHDRLSLCLAWRDLTNMPAHSKAATLVPSVPPSAPASRW